MRGPLVLRLAGLAWYGGELRRRHGRESRARDRAPVLLVDRVDASRGGAAFAGFRRDRPPGLRWMARTRGTRQKQAEPLNRKHVDRMISEGTGSRIIDSRDVALLAVVYDTLLRRSELCMLNIEDLAPAADGGATVVIKRSKTDAAGEGAVKYLAPDTVAAVNRWLEAAGSPQVGPLFRPVSRWGLVGPAALEPQEVRRLVAKVAAAAGLKMSRAPSGHSTRVGAAQDMLAAGLKLGEVMQAGSWRTVTMVARYGELLLAGRGAARKLAVMQNRA